jgi:hypothetical protein
MWLQFEKTENKPVVIGYVAAAAFAFITAEWLIHLPVLDFVSNPEHQAVVVHIRNLQDMSESFLRKSQNNLLPYFSPAQQQCHSVLLAVLMQDPHVSTTDHLPCSSAQHEPHLAVNASG